MKVFITGATGLIGTALVGELLARKNKITILTRDVKTAKIKFGEDVEYCGSLDSLTSFDDYDAIVNLAGESIGGKRWSARQKQRLERSRWMITRKLSELIGKSSNPPVVFVSGSAVGYYGDQGSTFITEDTPANAGFTHDLCRQWEAYALDARSDRTRVCLLRTCIVLSAKGGMLEQITPPFRFGLGSIMGKGNQYISWIHIDDMVGAICYLLYHSEAQGAFNVGSPNPVTNKEFSLILAKNLHRPCWFKIPAFIVRLLVGEGACLILDSQRAVPQKLEKMGYDFKFKHIDNVLRDIFRPDNE